MKAASKTLMKLTPDEAIYRKQSLVFSASNYLLTQGGIIFLKICKFLVFF
jgi:hypothetical protein